MNRPVIRDVWLLPQTGRALPEYDDAAVNRSVVALTRHATIFIPHNPQEAIMGRIEVLRRQNLGKRGVPLRGLRLSQVPQAGKTKTLEQYIERLKREMALAGLPAHPFAVMYIGLEVSTTIKMLCKRLLKNLGDPHWQVGNADDLRIRLHELMIERGVQLLIVDEVQHLNKPSNDRSDVTDELKRLLDNGTVPLVLVGDDTSLPFFQRNTALAGRLGAPLELSPLGKATARLFKDFCQKLDLAMVEAKVFHEPADLASNRMLRGLIKASGGHIGRVCRIIEAAVEHAALRDATRVEPFDVSHAIDSVAVVAKWVLRNPLKPTGS